MLKTLKFIEERIKSGQKVAFVTITDKASGAPGTPGQVIAVDKNGNISGTVGGGTTEYLIIQLAKNSILENKKTFEFDFKLEEKGMICGGGIKGFGVVLGDDKKLLVFGGGHVSQSIYSIAKNTAFNITVVDSREEFKPLFEKANYVSEIPEKYEFDENTYIIICTSGHKYDYDALSHCINKKYAYLGMIGSKTKVKTLLERLKSEGVSEETIAQIYAPIGIDISDGTPGEIAISVMAEILKIKNNGNLNHMRKH